MRLEIPYLDRLLPVDIPEKNLLFDIAPHNSPPAADF